MPTSKRERHGMTKTAEYTIWCRVKSRCNDPNDTNYKYYGGRGITISKEWNDSFLLFYRDMGDRPIGGSLDRIDNNKGYERGNCRWADTQTQANNKRSNHIITAKGRSMTIAQWSRETGIGERTIWTRLNKGDSDNESLRPVLSRNGK